MGIDVASGGYVMPRVVERLKGSNKVEARWSDEFAR